MFVEKLNKKLSGVYVIEEEKIIVGGKWEGYLEHDNARKESISIYTGSKFTGSKVQNYFISSPSETPWKTHLKVFSNSAKVYITYETAGDQIEAEDINLVQSTIVSTKEDLDNYRSSNDQRVLQVENRTTALESNKAAKTYVDTELSKKADKASTYTKTETDTRIQAIIGAAPSALDTLKEIGDALNNDPNFATTITNQLSQKVDKVVGKQLSTEDYTTAEKSKLAGITTGANNYVHPSTHPATMITEDATHRFVTDTEKTTWNGKAGTAVATMSANGLMSSTDKSKLDGVETGANKYVHPANHSASMITGLANVAISGNYNDLLGKPTIPTMTSQLMNDSGYVTQSELGNAGYGDMTKSIYDINGDGVVDKAERVEWSGVLNKPSTFTPSSHEHGRVQKIDDRDRKPVDTTKGYVEFVFTSLGGMTGVSNSDYQDMLVLNSYTDSSGGKVNALVLDKSEMLIRHYQANQTDTSWGTPKTLAYVEDIMKKGPLTWNDLKGV